MKISKLKIKESIRFIPFVGPEIYRWGQEFNRRRRAAKFVHRRLDAEKESDPVKVGLVKVRNLLYYTKSSGTVYSGDSFPAGYQSINIHGEELRGQRNPAYRIGRIPYDFSGKTIIDVGCNQGGMLFALADKIRWGVGVDYDYRMINVSNRIAAELNKPLLKFYVFNLEQEPLGLILDLLPDKKVDVVFLLSVCAWLRNWKEVIDFMASISETMLFEANGKKDQMKEQYLYLQKVYRKITHIDDPDDDPVNRKLYLCEH